MQKLVRIAVITPIALVILFLTSTAFERHSCAQAPATPKQVRLRTPKPQLTGTDGSQTGIAKFQGNLTTITAPSGQVLALSRGAGCSLLFLTGTYSNGSAFSYTSTGMTPNYERTLHSEAGLTTAVDSVPSGCADPTKGIGTRPATFVGPTKSGVNVYAGVFYNFMTNAESLYILTGESNFNVSVLSFSRAGLIATADLNGDGNGDLVVVNGANVPGTAQVFVLLGNSDGSFQTAVPYTIPGTNSVSAVIDDFDGNGTLDIIASSDNGQLSLLTGKGDGTFNTAQSFAAPTPVYPGSTLTPSASLSSLISADLRNTKHKDLIASNGLVMLNDGTGNFTPAASAAFPPATSLSNGGPYIASGDINRDGKLDIVLSTGYSTLTYLGKGDGTFTPGLGYVTINSDGFVTVTDLDGDGNPDIYIGDANGGLFRGDSTDANIAYALMGNGDGTFQGAPTITGLYTGTNMGDVNGDGVPDLITNNIGQFNQSEPSFVVELGTSKGIFNPVSTITLPPSITVSVSELLSPVTINTANLSITSYAVGDLNGDGRDDLAFVFNNGGYAVYGVALSNGDGTFATPVAYGFPQIAPSTGFDISTTIDNIHIGDFNHDGKADLIFNFNDIAGPTGTYLQGLVVLPGIGNGTFGAPIFTYTYNATTTPPNGGIPSIASINDLNGDNIPDLLAFNSSFTIVNGIGTPGTTLQVYLGKGDGTFSAPTTVATSTKLSSLVVADFNKDSKLDIAFLGESAIQQGQLFIALGNGNGTFATPTTLLLNGGDTVPNSGLASADFDGDGNNDLAFLDSESFSGIFYGKGDGTFTSVPIPNNNIAPKDLVNLFVGGSGGASIALDLNKDGHPDILSGNAILLSLYGTSTTTPTPVGTTTTLTASATTITTGSSITFTATVTPAAGSTGTPTGSVTFFDGITPLSIVPIASNKAIYTTTSLTTGSHGITAVYSGDPAFTTSTSSVFPVSVNLPVVATTTSLTPSVTAPVIGTTLTLTATVSPTSGTAIPTGTVIFNDGPTSLNTGTLDATGKATFSTSTLTVGNHNITATYVGATGFASSTSPAVAVTVTPADFTLSLLLTAANDVRGQTIGNTLTITGASNQSYSLACTGAPTNSSCVIPSAFTLPNGSPSGAVSFSFNAFVPATSSLRRFSNIRAAGILPLGLIGCIVLFTFGANRKRNPLVQLISLLATAILITITACGGSSQGTTTTPPPPIITPTPGIYPLTITVTSGAISHSVTYTVTIQ